MAENPEVVSMREEIKSLFVMSDKIRNKYNGKTADMPANEALEWDNMLKRSDDLKMAIMRVEKQDALDAWAASPASAGLPSGGGYPNAQRDAKNDEEALKKAVRGGWKKYIKGGHLVLTGEEIKAYQADNPVGGGFLVAPQDFVQELILKVKDQVFIRQQATIYTVDRAESLGIPAIDTEPSDADWTSELATGSEETTLAFGKRELRPHPVAKLVKVSNKLLRNSAMDPEAIVMDRMAYKMGVTQEKAYLLGTGADQPLGVFTASSQGIDTSRDTTAATTTAVAADDFISTKYSLKSQYQGTSTWIMHRLVVAATRKLKDQNNNYIWTTGLTGFGGATGPGNGLQGTPERLLDCPILMSEYAPSTALYMAILGDFKHYYIADSLQMQWQVLDQLYAATNQTGYIARSETDGMPYSSDLEVGAIWQ